MTLREGDSSGGRLSSNTTSTRRAFAPWITARYAHPSWSTKQIASPDLIRSTAAICRASPPVIYARSFLIVLLSRKKCLATTRLPDGLRVVPGAARPKPKEPPAASACGHVAGLAAPASDCNIRSVGCQMITGLKIISQAPNNLLTLHKNSCYGFAHFNPCLPKTGLFILTLKATT